MLSALPMSNVQVTNSVETAPVAVPKAEPVLGMLPTTIVPASLSGPKIANDQRSASQMMQSQNVATNTNAQAIISPFSNAGSGQIVLPSPFSTTFLAQLFGQVADGRMDGIVSSMMDFDYLAEISVVKYKPSFASRPPVAEAPRVTVSKNAQPQITPDTEIDTTSETEIHLQPTSISGINTSETPSLRSADKNIQSATSNPPLFSRVSEAYTATQTRNQQSTTSKSTGGTLSVIM